MEVHFGKDEDAVGEGFPVTVLDLHLHHGEGIVQEMHQDARPDGIGDHEQHAQDDADDKGIEKLSGILMEQPEHESGQQHRGTDPAGATVGIGRIAAKKELLAEPGDHGNGHEIDKEGVPVEIIFHRVQQTGEQKIGEIGDETRHRLQCKGDDRTQKKRLSMDVPEPEGLPEGEMFLPAHQCRRQEHDRVHDHRGPVGGNDSVQHRRDDVQSQYRDQKKPVGGPYGQGGSTARDWGFLQSVVVIAFVHKHAFPVIVPMHRSSRKTGKLCQ